MDQSQLNWVAGDIWGIADDVLRDLYVRGKYRDVILPITVLRRLDALLESTKTAVLAMKESLDNAGVTNQDAALRKESGQAFYNTSKFTLRDLRSRSSQQQLRADFEAYLDGFSSNVQHILENFEFRNQIPRLSKADALGTLIEKPASVRKELQKLIENWGSEADDSDEGESEETETSGKGLTEAKKRKLLNEDTWKRDALLVDIATKLRAELGGELFADYNNFLQQVEAASKKLGITLNATNQKLIINAVSWKAEDAPPVIKKIHKSGKGKKAVTVHSDPIHGLFEAEIDGQTCVVEYEPDSELRDFEQIPLLEEGGVEAFIRREVLPYTPDAWIVQSDTKIGYEISFTRHFYEPPKLRTLAEISADILALEQETEGLLSEITKGVTA